MDDKGKCFRYSRARYQGCLSLIPPEERELGGKHAGSGHTVRSPDYCAGKHTYIVLQMEACMYIDHKMSMRPENGWMKSE